MGEARATPPARMQPILWRSAAGSAINNNGLEIRASSLAWGTDSAPSRLLWIPVRPGPPSRALETVAALPGVCTAAGLHPPYALQRVGAAPCWHPERTPLSRALRLSSLEGGARGSLTGLGASAACAREARAVPGTRRRAFLSQGTLFLGGSGVPGASTTFHLWKETFGWRARAAAPCPLGLLEKSFSGQPGSPRVSRDVLHREAPAPPPRSPVGGWRAAAPGAGSFRTSRHCPCNPSPARSSPSIPAGGSEILKYSKRHPPPLCIHNKSSGNGGCGAGASEGPGLPQPLGGPRELYSLPRRSPGWLCSLHFPRLHRSELLRVLSPSATSPRKQLLPLAFHAVLSSPTDERRPF